MNIYRIVGKSHWEFWVADTEDEAKQKFLEYFPNDEVISCDFEIKSDDAIFRSMSNGLVMRF